MKQSIYITYVSFGFVKFGQFVVAFIGAAGGQAERRLDDLEVDSFVWLPSHQIAEYDSKSDISVTLANSA